MKKIIPITDLQRQASQIVGGFGQSDEPVIITQRGRAAAVLLPVGKYAQIEEDLARLDELEMLALTQQGLDDFAHGRTLTSREAGSRLEKKHAVTTPRPRRAK